MSRGLQSARTEVRGSCAVEDHLASLNRRLAALLRCDEVELSRGGGRSLEDRLWVWGIVGGKEVGKSTLINALAGGEVVDRGSRVGEGTSSPGAYLCAGDSEGIRARFSGLAGMSIAYHAEAPASMAGLALVDLPDFDSLFDTHVEQVRRIAGVLDGIIWVTTPKKVGDLRAIREVRRVLKARTNFVYVVNKLDWLLGQSDGDVSLELDRVGAALAAQVGGRRDGGTEGRRDGGTTGGEGGRSFLISAKYGSSVAIAAEVARSRGRTADGEGGMTESENGLGKAIERVVRDFEGLQEMLTAAPTAEAADANKRANLVYQSRRQAGNLLGHFDPRGVLDRLEEHVSPEEVDALVEECFPPAYQDGLARALRDDRGLVGDWSATLFERRIAYWPLMGWIAWPAALLVSAVRGLRSAIPLGLPGGGGEVDAFRRDGLSLEERVDGAVAGVRAGLARVSRRFSADDVRPGVRMLHPEIPDARELAGEIRAEVHRAVEAEREMAIAPYATRCPGVVGRGVRWLVPILVLIWFPLAQPVLSGVLSLGGIGSDLESAALVVQVLSAGNVLMGLGVSVLLLGMLTAAVYSRAVRDAMSAGEQLRGAAAGLAGGSFVGSVARRIDQPVVRFRSELSSVTEAAELLADGSTTEPEGDSDGE